MVKPEKIGHLHLVYHFTVPLKRFKKILKIWDTLFGCIQVEEQCSKNYFKIYLSQEAGAFGNNIEKELQKPHPTLKNMNIKYLQGIFALPAIQCKL